MRSGNFGAYLLTFALVFLTGCRQSASKLTIAVIPRDTAGEIWVSEHGGAVDAAHESRLHIYWNGPSRDDDVEQQIALSERAVARHYYGLILSPNNSFALGNLIQRAVSSGIPVVITGSEIPLVPRPGLSQFPNVSRTIGSVRSPGVRNLGFSLVKETQLLERLHMQFRAEAFNLTTRLFKQHQ